MLFAFATCLLVALHSPATQRQEAAAPGRLHPVAFTRRQAVSLVAAAAAAPAWPASAALSAREQIKAGGLALDALLDSFDEVTAAEGGDGVRRILGTVGTTSPIFQSEKAFRKLADEVDDPERYFDRLEALALEIAAAESEAYSANFITFSSAKGSPEQYFAKSKEYTKRARDEWRTLESMLP